MGRIFEKGFLSPAGDITFIKMKSLSFSEFLGAFHVRDLYVKTDLFGASEASNYDDLRKFYKLYTVVGGYPAIVQKVIENENLFDVATQIEELVRIFCEESRRYFQEIEAISLLQNLLSGVASLLMKEKKGHINFNTELQSLSYGVNTNKKMISRAVAWLLNSGIIDSCSCYNDCKFDQSRINTRFYFSDLGIANYFYSKVAKQQSDKVGQLAENFAYLAIEHIIANQNIIHDTPHFGTYGQDGEIDFMYFVRSKGNLISIAVEVKEGKVSGKTAQKLLNDKKINYLVYAKGNSNGGKDDQILTIPLTLLGRFNIFDFVQDDVSLERQQFSSLINELKKF